MTRREIIQHIDDGANYYVSLFGEAIHMEKADKKFYSYVKPKAGEKGITFIYDVRINDLPPEQINAVIDEMKSMHMPIWLGLLASEEVAFIFAGNGSMHDILPSIANNCVICNAAKGGCKAYGFARAV